MKHKTYLILTGIVLVSLFFNLYKHDSAPVCFNADEAAFSYNAYSILKTGRDEYGTFLPLRLKSFGDYKLPLFTYFSVPFIGLFGLNETAARLPNTFLSALLPIAIFLFVKQLFARDDVSLLAAALSATTLALHIIGRHAHEAYLASFLIAVTGIFFVRLLKKVTITDTLCFLISCLLSLFAYQSSRILIGIYFLYAVWYFLPRKKGYWLIGGFVAVLMLFFVTDLLYKPSRVTNLLFFNNLDYTVRLNELRGEAGARLFYNKVAYAPKVIVAETLKYFSSQFLLDMGDENPRFGFRGMSLITPVVYLFFFAGLYFLFKNRERWRYLLVAFILLTPLSASLAWAGISLTRSLYLFVLMCVVAGYGGIYVWETAPKKYRFVALGCVMMAHLYFSFYAWDFYLNHYFKRALIVRAWQCGYRELGQYVKSNYDKYDKFYITRQHGEPYIFMLFYLQYPPAKYQQQARLTGPDKYGFGQVEQFDKFRFHFLSEPAKEKNVAVVGYPIDDFTANQERFPSLGSAQKIKINTEEVFWVYENR